MSAGRLGGAIAAGVVIGLLITVSPLMIVASVLGALVVVGVRRGLPADERRLVTTILVAAMAARVLVVAIVAVWGIPLVSAQSGGGLVGDEAYMFERSLRTRDILLGFPVAKLDYMMAFDNYADTKYTGWLTWLQTTFGPSPYAIRLLNGALFVAAAAVMYRVSRMAFGARAAQCGLTVLLFMPSLLFWSVSLLKDSVYFLLTAIIIAAVVAFLRGRDLQQRSAALVIFAIALWGLADLRPWAVTLTSGGLALGLAMYWLLGSRIRMAVAASVLLLTATVVASSEPAAKLVLRGLTWGAQQHVGHAQTPGRSYRTLDNRFYSDFQSVLADKPMRPAEGFRYVVRAAGAFVIVPLPWQAATTTELLFVPEQLLWFLCAALALFGLRAAYRRDALFASLLVGYIGIISAALALINGNVGTLVRLRGLVARFVVWIAAVGLMSAIVKLTGDKGPGTGSVVDREGRAAGRINLVDALCLAFVAGLIPLAYVSWLLFQPARPVIHSVERSEITSAEEKIAAGLPIRLKVKVRGEHLTPMLRAYVGSVPAMGFTFETPASGDVIIGENVPPGTHDLILFDGLVEVARAPGAVSIVASAGVPIRAVGAFTLLDERTANSLKVGQTFDIDGRRAAEILALGSTGPDRREIAQGTASVQQATTDTWSREAILRTHCDPDPDPTRCRIGGTILTGGAPSIIVIPGSSPVQRMRVDAIVPDAAPSTAVARIRVSGTESLLSLIRTGDRDTRWPAIDDRRASVERVERSGPGGTIELVVRLGLDRASDGWRYHSQRFAAGSPFTLVTEGYSALGTVTEMVINEQ